MLNLGFLASHNGSLMQAVVRACEEKRLAATPCLVIGNNQPSGALQFAIQKGIPWRHLSLATHKDAQALDKAILEALQINGVELVLLVGYMKLLGPRTIAAYPRHILNIHPALLPKFGGQGMYGIRVHEAVLAAGEKETGVTIHHVNERYDEGNIIAQCKLPVMPDDTPQTLAARVLQREHSFIVETLQDIIAGKIKLCK
jgi:phosphoribosylglycinamide formyltransferase-1